jgi:hypothetical protein
MKSWQQALAPLAAVVIGAAVGKADTLVSEWVYPGQDGKLVYKRTPVGDRIMDFSHAGYMGGGVALPTVPVKRTVRPPGSADDTAAIQAAIDAVSALPLAGGFRGAVLLAPGTFVCSNTINLSASGVVLRGSGSGAKDGARTTLKLTGKPHTAITVRGASERASRGRAEFNADAALSAQTTITDAYVPSGTASFTVADAAGFAVGDTIEVRRPVTPAWIRFMGMDDLVRDGKPQTWIRAGTRIATLRQIAAISGSRLTLDVPLSDSYDAKYLSPPGTMVGKVRPPSWPSQVGIEGLHIESPPQAINHTEAHFTALRMTAQDAWVRDVVIDETMNSVGINGRRLTLERVAVNRQARHEGSSKPAEFAPNGDQILLDRCSVSGDNIWFMATGGGHAGPIVLLNCVFQGNGRAEGHQRWTTGVLMDNCRAPQGGIDFRNRGSMGSGHGWASGWSVAWNCEAADYVVQQPPGSANWMIGCLGTNKPAPRPFGSAPNLPLGIMDSPGKPVTPRSLYLSQLAERLGPQVLKNIGY